MKLLPKWTSLNLTEKRLLRSPKSTALKRRPLDTVNLHPNASVKIMAIAAKMIETTADVTAAAVTGIAILEDQTAIVLKTVQAHDHTGTVVTTDIARLLHPTGEEVVVDQGVEAGATVDHLHHPCTEMDRTRPVVDHLFLLVLWLTAEAVVGVLLHLTDRILVVADLAAVVAAEITMTVEMIAHPTLLLQDVMPEGLLHG